MTETYEIKIERNDTEFEVVSYDFPEDRFGKKMLSVLFAQISQHLQDEVEASEGE